MSYPPPPGQGPNNPYAPPPQGQPGYGYPQQGMPQAPYSQQPMYGHPQQGGIPPFPGGPVQPMRMPGTVVTARVLLFVAGSLWALASVFGLIGLVAASGSNDAFTPAIGGLRSGVLGFVLIYCLLMVGLATMHIVSASMFGKGRGGTRVTAIVAASLNALFPLLGFFGALDSSATNGSAAGGMVLSVLWLGTAVLTVVFCSLGTAGQWFNRARY